MRLRLTTPGLPIALICICLFVLAGCGGDGASSSEIAVAGQPEVSGATGGPAAGSESEPAEEQESESAEHGHDHSEDTARPNVAARDKTKLPSPGSGRQVTVGAFDALYSTIDGEIETTRTKALVAQNQSSYNALIAKQFGNAAPKDDRLKVDFAGGEQVIAVYAPPSKRGSRIEVNKLLTDGSSTEVRATLYVPPRDCAASTGHAYIPAQWVVTRKLPARTSVTVRQQSIDC